jgi:hypothetical protein
MIKAFKSLNFSIFKDPCTELAKEATGGVCSLEIDWVSYDCSYCDNHFSSTTGSITLVIFLFLKEPL